MRRTVCQSIWIGLCVAVVTMGAVGRAQERPVRIVPQPAGEGESLLAGELCPVYLIMHMGPTYYYYCLNCDNACNPVMGESSRAHQTGAGCCNGQTCVDPISAASQKVTLGANSSMAPGGYVPNPAVTPLNSDEPYRGIGSRLPGGFPGESQHAASGITLSSRARFADFLWNGQNVGFDLVLRVLDDEGTGHFADFRVVVVEVKHSADGDGQPYRIGVGQQLDPDRGGDRDSYLFKTIRKSAITPLPLAGGVQGIGQFRGQVTLEVPGGLQTFYLISKSPFGHAAAPQSPDSGTRR